MQVRIFLVIVVLMLSGCSDDNDSLPAQQMSTAQSSFLSDNAARENVFVTESGLQYEVLRAAEGPKPGAQSTVTVHYVGEFVDGTEFDSSIARGTPSTFKLSQVIPGWTEGLQLMTVGSQFRFVIPSNLGYGERGRLPTIAPDTDLVFVVDLLEINSN